MRSAHRGWEFCRLELAGHGRAAVWKEEEEAEKTAVLAQPPAPPDPFGAWVQRTWDHLCFLALPRNATALALLCHPCRGPVGQRETLKKR